jgi:hypothetical protein
MEGRSRSLWAAAVSIPRSLREIRCPCGSGLFQRPLYDARAIFCCYVCGKCEPQKRKQYRNEIFTDGQYWTSEPIEEE